MDSNFESIQKWLRSGTPGFYEKNSELSHSIDDFFNYIFNNSSDGIGLIDLDFNIIGVNSTLSDWYAKKKPFLWNKCFKVYHNRSVPCEDCPSLVSMKTGRMQSGIVPYESEKERWGEQVLSTFPVRNEIGKVVAVIEHVRDKRKKDKGQLAMVNLNSMLDTQSQKIMEQELALGMLGRQLSESIYNSNINVHEKLKYQLHPYLQNIISQNKDKELEKQLRYLENMILSLDSTSMNSMKLEDKNLTFREKQIAHYIQKGFSSKEISDVLCIAQKTVDFHRSNLRKKLKIYDKQIDLKSFLNSKPEIRY